MRRLLCWLILAVCASAQTATITGSATITGQATIPPFASMSTPTITNPSCVTPPCPLTTGTSGVAYAFTFAATGGAPAYTWTLTVGTLPSGLSLNGSTGAITGTTSATGTFNLTVQVTDTAFHIKTLAITLTISSASSAISANLYAAGWNNMSRTPPPPVWCPTDSNGAKGSLTGMRLHDDGVKWGNIETAPNTYNFLLMDEIVNVLAPGSTQFGGQTPPCAMHIIYTLSSTPQWDTACGTANPSTCLPGRTGSGYGGGTQCSGVTIWGCLPTNDINPDGSGTNNHFQQFITAMLMRYPNKIAYYEIWNEPDSPNFWCIVGGTVPCGSSTISLTRMVRLAWDYYNLVHCLSPTSQVLSPSFHGPTALTWMHNYVTTSVAVPAISIAGCSVGAQTVTGKQTFDITNAHMRGSPNSDPTAFLGAYNSVVSEISNDGLPTALFNDEFGYVGLSEAANPDIQAAYVAIQYALNASVGPPRIQQAYWYEWDGTSNNTAQLQGTIAGTAFDQMANWTIGNLVGAFSLSGTIYTETVGSGKVTWDMSQNCTLGCTTSNQTETGYHTYYDLLGASHPVSVNLAPVGLKPILLSTATLYNQYYVDPSIGNDTWDGSQPTHGAGSVGPWQSICKADAALALNTAGAVVHFAAGTYDTTNQSSQGGPCYTTFTDGTGHVSMQLATTHVGTATQRILLTGPTPFGASGAKITGNWFSYGNYVDIQNFECTNPYGPACWTFGQFDHTVTTKGNFSSLRFNYIHDIGNVTCSSGIDVGGGAATAVNVAFRAHDTTIDSNIINNIDVPYGCSSDTGNGGYGIYIQGPHNTVTNNMVSNTEGGGLSVYHNVCNELIAFNVFVHNGVRGFEIGGTDGDSHNDCPATSATNDFTTIIGNVVIDNGWTCGASNTQNPGVVGAFDFYSVGTSSTHNTFAYNAAYNNWSATGNRNCTSSAGTNNSLVLHNSASPLGLATSKSGNANTGLVITFGDSVVPAANPALGGTSNFQPLTSGPLYNAVPSTTNATYCAGSPGFTNPCLPIPDLVVAARNALTNIGAY